MKTPAPNQALARDVELFTTLLGEVLREHSRKRLLVIVERLRVSGVN